MNNKTTLPVITPCYPLTSTPQASPVSGLVYVVYRVRPRLCTWQQVNKHYLPSWCFQAEPCCRCTLYKSSKRNHRPLHCALRLPGNNCDDLGEGFRLYTCGREGAPGQRFSQAAATLITDQDGRRAPTSVAKLSYSEYFNCLTPDNRKNINN